MIKILALLAYHLHLPHKGIILFKLISEQPMVKIDRLNVLFQKDMDLTSSFIVITLQRKELE